MDYNIKVFRMDYMLSFYYFNWLTSWFKEWWVFSHHVLFILRGFDIFENI